MPPPDSSAPSLSAPAPLRNRGNDRPNAHASPRRLVPYPQASGASGGRFESGPAPGSNPFSMVKHQLTQRLRLDAAGPFRDPLPSHLPPSGATEPLRSHSQSKVRTATHDGPGYCWVRLRLRRSALGLHACTTRPGRSGCSPASSRSPGRATPPSRPSRTRDDIGPSPGTGTPPSPSPATAASAAT